MFVNMAEDDELDLEVHDLPQGVYRRDTVSKTMRWPADLYDDLGKICHKIKKNKNKTVAITRLVIYVMASWKEKNKHLLGKDKGKK